MFVCLCVSEIDVLVNLYVCTYAHTCDDSDDFSHNPLLRRNRLPVESQCQHASDQDALSQGSCEVHSCGSGGILHGYLWDGCTVENMGCAYV